MSNILHSTANITCLWDILIITDITTATGFRSSLQALQMVYKNTFLKKFLKSMF
jgi:hypothetical protein